MTTTPSQTLVYESSFEVLAEQLKIAIGYHLLTASYIIAAENVAVRIYSSLPQLYPVGGRQIADDGSDWQQGMQRGECFIANQPSEFGEHFTHLNEIVEQGFGAVANMPVIIEGKLIGSLNLLHKTGAYANRQAIVEAFLSMQALTEASYLAYQNAMTS